jgi:hypothetical protein
MEHTMTSTLLAASLIEIAVYLAAVAVFLAIVLAGMAVIVWLVSWPTFTATHPESSQPTEVVPTPVRPGPAG